MILNNGMLPASMTPADLPWWGWLLCAVGAGVLGAALTSLANKENGCLATVIRNLAFIGALILFVIGIIRFIKWVWAG